MIFMCHNYMGKETHKCFERVLLYKLGHVGGGGGGGGGLLASIITAAV